MSPLRRCAAAPLLHDYAEVLANLKLGNRVNVAVDLALCAPLAGTARPFSQGGFQIKAYRLKRTGALSFADDHLTVTDEGRPIRQLTRYTIQKNNAVDVRIWMFNLPSYRPYQHSFAYACGLGQGIDLNVADL